MSMDRLYKLLPELYRWRDESNKYALQEFLAVIEEEFAQLEDDMGAAYDNWFIETCDGWVVPYVAELLGVRDVAHGERLPFTQRRRVANTLAYRRRKGTISVLEQVMWDVTNWHVRAIEFHRLVAVSQHIRHRTPEAGRVMDLRHEAGAMDAGSPLSTAAHTLDIRTIENRVAEAVMEGETPRATASSGATSSARHDSQGKFNLNNIGLFFWRLRSYPVTRAWPQQRGQGCYVLHPTGRDMPLFNRPQRFSELSQRAQRVHLPVPLSREELDDDIRTYMTRYGDEGNARPDHSRYYGPGRSFYLKWDETPIPPHAIVSSDLSGWLDGARVESGAFEERTALVDPELGRVVLVEPHDSDASETVVNGALTADYTFGFSGDIGGGPYPRRIELDVSSEPYLEIHVAQAEIASMTRPTDTWSLDDWHENILNVHSVTDGLELWEKYCWAVGETELEKRPKPRGVIRILDNFVYRLDEMVHLHHVDEYTPAHVTLPESAELSIVAASGVQPTLEVVGESLPIVFDLPPKPGPAPRAQMLLMASPALDQLPLVVDRQLHLSGLMVTGSLAVTKPENPKKLNMMDLIVEECTLVDGGISTASDIGDSAAALDVQIIKSIIGPIRLPEQAAGLTITDSIVDCRIGDPQQGSTTAIGGTTSAAGPICRMERCTIFGSVHLRALVLASATIWTERILVDRTDRGRVEFCYIPAGSKTPPGEDCLCADAVTGGNVRNPTIVAPPTFTSRRYGHPGYAQLSMLHSAPEFAQISGDGAEIGVFHDLYQPQREANIRQVLERYLPLGLRSGSFYMT